MTLFPHVAEQDRITGCSKTSLTVTSLYLEFFLLICCFFQFVPLIEPANLDLYLEIHILSEYLWKFTFYPNLEIHILPTAHLNQFQLFHDNGR
jgi:hypothetical protein